jgi:branched-chain amino acid transport system ATP-binding protein
MSALAVTGLTKRFIGLAAVNDVSFEVQNGSITALIGPNGAGKTTCFNMIAGMLQPTAGTVRFNGRDVAGLGPEQMCGLGVARTFQVVRPLAHMSVLDNVMVGALHRTPRLAEARSQALEVLERVGLRHKAAFDAADLTLPDRKMLEMARALATRPTLLMLDEVMAGSRHSEADRIVGVLRELNAQGLTILLTEHVMRIVMSLAHQVVVLHHGEKIAQGAPREIAANPRVIESYLGRSKAR